ncbi:MAG TPA: Xaa-Pro dipeptidase [Steroidobacteraceae bacterium]
MSALLAALYDDHIRVQRTRTDAALQACGFDSLAIFAGRPPMQFLDDRPYPFAPNPHFKLWVPLETCAECWLIYRPQAPLQLLFFQPIDYWYKPPALPSGYWTKHFDIEVIREPGDARAFLAGMKHCAFIGERQPEFDAWGFAAFNPQALIDHLHFDRARKTSYEVECMRRAAQRGARGHVAAERAFRAGASEFQIHLEYLRATQHTEAELPYDNIIALNENAAVLHYQYQERTPPPQRFSLLIDAGAAFAGYACDITRTYSAEQDDFAALISAMDTVQQALCAKVRAGVDYADIHLDAHHRIATVLREHGIIRMDPASAVESGLSSVFFPHGVGHLLGLQVHDVAGLAIDRKGTQKPRPPGHPYLRLTRTLEPGFVVTIEPGLYFIETLLAQARAAKHASSIDWQRVEALKRFGGIRIEDDVACTESEPENLTRPALAQAAAA